MCKGEEGDRPWRSTECTLECAVQEGSLQPHELFKFKLFDITLTF